MRRLSLHRPSPATVISVVALFFAMTGTAYAATGGDFLLGKSNTATAVTSLSNTKGTALSLSSTSSTPPLTVSNSVQVPKLNASQLDGQSSSAFLSATGTAANSNELGGTSASGYMKGGGNTTAGTLTLTAGEGGSIVGSPSAVALGACGNNGADMYLQFTDGTNSGATVLWWNKDGVGSDPNLLQEDADLTPPSTTPYVVVAQVNNLDGTVSTFTVNQSYDSQTQTCQFFGQVVLAIT